VQVEVGAVADTRFEVDFGGSARRDMLYIYLKAGCSKPPAVEVDAVVEILCVSDQIADFRLVGVSRRDEEQATIYSLDVDVLEMEIERHRIVGGGHTYGCFNSL
jgi:hypothetical protein